MINYFRKRKNFNRIKKLIQTNPVCFEGTFAREIQRNINLYYVQDIIISLYQIQVYREYAVFETLPLGSKQIDLDENQIKILLELAETKHQKPYWIK